MSTLSAPATASVLKRIAEHGRANDAVAKAGFRARRAEREAPFTAAEAADLHRDAALSVTPEVGRLLYMLARSSRAAQIVEFGTSFGASAIHLAAALCDLGSTGRLITTELNAAKASAARRNLEEAGLDGVVEVRDGDARDTLRELPDPIDLLFLDGWGDLYLPVLRLVERRLSAGAIVVADRSSGSPYWAAYTDYVRAPEGGYVSVELALGDGVELSVRL